MVDFIQSAPIKAAIIADLKGLGLGDPPLHQRITVMGVILAAVRFIGGDADVVKDVLLLFRPVGLFGDQVGFELAGTPSGNSMPVSA